MLKAVGLLGLLALSANAFADVHAMQAWSRFTAPSVPTGVVFLQLHNSGKQTDALVSATTPVAKKVELHNHIHDQGVMRMRQVPKIDVAAGGTVALQPGGYHMMLLDLKQPLKLNQTFPVTLKYQSGRSEKITVTVNNGKGMQQNGHSMNHGQGDMQH